MRSWRRKVVTGLAIGGFCLGILVLRTVWEGRGALADGDLASERDDHHEAIAKWRRAARWYVPLGSHVGDAYDRLQALAVAAEQRGDTATALSAWRGVRGSILATRSFYTPHKDRLGPANQAIARLMASVESENAAPGQSEAERRAWHYQLLSRDESPSVGWAMLALLGLALWIGGGFGFALRGVSSEDQLIVRPAAISAACIGLGLVVWLLGLYKA